ncbi:MAG: ABC transporter substrate-binding protein [Chloroflexi bacterium]|nr:ABC transporter substrate-binding protein [Chloroflexota bacterium]
MQFLGYRATRREFLRIFAVIGGAIGTVGSAGACAPASAPPPTQAPVPTQAPAAAKPTAAPAVTQAPAAAKPTTAPAPATQAPAKAASGGTVRLTLTWSPQRADPHNHQTSADYVILANIYDRLVDLDPKNLSPRPGLATSWKAANDTTWEFKLRTGVKFSDGTPFDAAAAKKNVERQMESASTKPFTNKFESVEAKDAETIVIKTKTPYAQVLYNLGVPQMGVISPAAIDKGKEWLSTNAVGSGPFVLKEWVAKERFVLERNPNYWGPAVKIERALFRVVPDENARLAGLKSGELDVIGDPPVPTVKALESDANLRVLKLPVARTYFFMYQMGDPIISNLKVRQAIAAAINRKALVELVSENLNRMANTLLPPEALDGEGANPQLAIEYNPDRAKALLAESGVNLSGKPLKMIPDMTVVAARDTAQAVQEDLRKVGIGVEIVLLEQAKINETLAAHQYQIAPSSWQTADPDSALNKIFSERSPWPWANHHNAEFERNVDKAATIIGDAERRAAYKEIFRYLLQDAIYLPLYHKNAIVGMSKKVEGLRWSPLDFALLSEVSVAG